MPPRADVRRSLGAAAVVAALAAAVGCRSIAESQVERSLNGMLPRYLGPAKSYSTHVRAKSAGAVMRGRMRTVHIDGEEVHLPAGGPVIERLTLELDDVSVDPKARRLEGIGAARFQTRIVETELNRFLAARRPDDAGLLRVALGDGVATVEARPALLARFGVTGLTVPVTIRGRLRASGGPKLDFVPDTVRVLALPVPASALRLLFGDLNPVADLSGAPLPLNVREAVIQKGTLTLIGDVPPEAVLQAAAAQSAEASP